jgi:glucosyl-3-phosphoglycerate synthase
MSDFAQTGLICTLQRLNDTSAERIESELAEHAVAHPITLILPCHGKDLRQPALKGIIDEIAGARFLREVLVSMNGWDEETAQVARDIFARLPQPHRILWNDGPRAVAVKGAMAAPMGKGFNVWAACGVVIAEAQSQVIATQDCDVVSFRRENLARLCFAAVHPELRYDFAKMYYSRVTDRLYGRVSRLFLTPLLQAIVRVAGHQPLLDFLQSFRYPLAGECVITRELAAALPFSAGWGLEVGLLCEAFRRAEPRRIAQVDGGRHYDHRHQPLGDERGGLFRMSREIAVTLLAQLCDEGLQFSPSFLEVLQASFERESREALRRSRHLALINGLLVPREDEEAAAVFARALSEAGREFLDNSPLVAARTLPAWADAQRTSPDWIARFLEAVADGIG